MPSKSTGAQVLEMRGEHLAHGQHRLRIALLRFPFLEMTPGGQVLKRSLGKTLRARPSEEQQAMLSCGSELFLSGQVDDDTLLA